MDGWRRKGQCCRQQTGDCRYSFCIGSVSKSFAALAALRLQEEGKLKLADKVRQWVPEVAFTNPWEATDPVVGMVLVALLMLSAILFAPIWGLRMLLGKLQNAGPLAVRVLPLLSAVLLAAFDGLFAIGLRGLITADRIDDLFILGVPSWLTVSILFVSIAFPLTAVVSLYVVYRARAADMNRMAYWHSVLVALAMVAVAVYHRYWGLIGLRLWV